MCFTIYMNSKAFGETVDFFSIYKFACMHYFVGGSKSFNVKKECTGLREFFGIVIKPQNTFHLKFFPSR